MRRIRAQRIGTRFTFISKFLIPENVTCDGNKHTIAYPKAGSCENAFVEIFLDDGYCLDRLKNEPIKRVLDVGANIGLFSIAARMHFPEAVIHSYEPNAQLEPVLKQNSLNAGFQFFIEAVGDRNSKCSMKYSEGGSCMDQVTEDKNGAVQQIALRDAVRRLGGADLVKLDCEGYEWRIMNEKDAWRDVKFLTMEYHFVPQRHSIAELEDTVKKLRFKILRRRKVDGYSGLLLAGR